MITVRYHIASLCAMILMLGIGISIGLILGQNIEKHQADLTKEYYHRLHDLRQEEQDDTALLSQNRQVVSALVPHFSRSLLSGKRVAIIRTGDYSDAAQNAADALSLTGAVLTSSITITSQLDDTTERQRAGILGNLTDAPSASTDSGDNSNLYHTLVEALKTGTSKHQDVQSAVDRMSSFGYISYSGNLQQPVDLIIVVGGSSLQSTDTEYTNEQAREKMTIDQLTSNGEFTDEQVVGCEPYAAVTSSIPLFQQEGISAVDCIDDPIGALDIVYALRGETGTYGLKQGNRLLLPAPLTGGGS
jgi:hypothetical protein